MPRAPIPTRDVGGRDSADAGEIPGDIEVSVGIRGQYPNFVLIPELMPGIGCQSSSVNSAWSGWRVRIVVMAMRALMMVRVVFQHADTGTPEVCDAGVESFFVGPRGEA